ncbi:ABC transporter ATP-binding protein, partial [Staphylococcus agnetis]
MKISDYNLIVKSRVLLKDVNVEFFKGSINHIVGKNGVGKSMFAKDLILNKNLHPNLSKSITLISSASNVPYDITKNDLINILTNTFSQNEKMVELMDMLHIHS